MVQGFNKEQTIARSVVLETQFEAQRQAYANASISGSRVFLCHLYRQAGREHLLFSVPCSLLLQLAQSQRTKTRKNKSFDSELINRPISPQHVNEIAKYLLETENYILPPFIFNCRTPIKIFAYGDGTVKIGYAVIPNDLELFITDGQHRIAAIAKAIEEKPSLSRDNVAVQIVFEEDRDRIQQDFADCAKNKPIAPALLAAFDVDNNVLSKLTNQMAKELVIFGNRIDRTSRSVGKDPKLLFTMSQLRTGVAEFLFGSSRKKTIESHSKIPSSEWGNLLDKGKKFYLLFAENNETWKDLIEPLSTLVDINFYTLRQERIDFNTVGFQIISRIGHQIFFDKEYNDEERQSLIEALASLDFNRDAVLWQGNIVVEDKKIITNIAAVDLAFKVAIAELEKLTGIKLNS